MPGYDGYNPYTSTGTYTGTTGTTKPGTSGGYTHPSTNNNQGNVDTSAWQQAAETMSQAGIGSIGGKILTGDMGYGDNEDQFQINQQAAATQEAAKKMLAFQKAQANYDKYGDDLSKWLQDPEAYEHAYDTGFFESQAEGMLGGVTQYEKDVNLMKKAIQSKIGKMNTQGLTDKQFESGLTSLPEYESLLKLYGGDADAMHATLFAPGTFDPNVDTGYDPTGTNTWQDTEGDPEKLAAYHLLTGGDPNDNPYSDEYIDALGKILYGFPSFDQSWSGMDDFDQRFYGPGGPTEASETFAGAPWMQKGLGEIIAEGPKGFGEMESIYGEEFDPSREASWLYLTGIPQFSDQTIYDYV